MFIGHFGLALAAKKVNQKPSLGTYFLAAQFIDLLWPFFLILKIEQVAVEPGNTAFTPLNFISYPYSHSLTAVFIWAAVFSLTYYIFKKNRQTAFLLGLLVLSHWVLDLITHRPDLPLSFTEDTKVGLGLWNNKVATLITECIIFLVGVYLYLFSTEVQNNIGKFAFWGLILFLLAVYFMNAFGDPPPDENSIGYIGLSQWLLIIWAYWVDNNRIAKSNVL